MDLFLAAVVLHGKQANAVEAKELAQPLLDGRRGNLLSLHIDDIGDASLQRDTAIGSHDREIAGIEEAVPEKGPRRRFVIEVAGRPPPPRCWPAPARPGGWVPGDQMHRRSRPCGRVGADAIAGPLECPAR